MEGYSILNRRRCHVIAIQLCEVGIITGHDTEKGILELMFLYDL